MSFDAASELRKIRAEILEEQERAERRAIIDRQAQTRPEPNAVGVIDIGPTGTLTRAEGVMVNGRRFMDEFRLATGWGTKP